MKFAVTIFSVVSIFLTSAAYANFINLDSVDSNKLPHNIEKLKKANIWLGNCSGTYIGKKGYILTALHCVKSKSAWTYPYLIQNIFTFAFLDQQKLSEEPKYSYQVGYEGPYGKDGVPMQVKVVAAGKGFHVSSNYINLLKAEPGVREKFLDNEKSGSQDWAILKIEIENAPCVNIRATQLAPSEPVLSIGYRSREDLVATLHRQSRMYFSSGVVTNGILDNVAFQTWIQKTPQSSKKLEFTEFFLKLTTHPSVFFSTLDGLPGSSGQGIFDHDGNLVGVARAIMKFDSNILEYYVPGTLQSIIVASIIEHLNEINHPEINDIFECSQ